MNKKLHLIILISFFACLTVCGQENTPRQIYDEAESNYNIGRIEQAVSLLGDNMSHFTGNLKQSAMRLMALCWLGLDDDEQAKLWTRMLLNDDPYYTASPQDSQRFIDMIEDIKSGQTATITTASSQAEKLDEVPVPTTLITEDMIKSSGARNLQEVLAAYVPSMNIIDCNDDINIAMRGIYSNGQEKILIMLNGHRLNSYVTNIAAPDFSIGLDKLKQIEVLRGPASSLYGGVSLTAVVNLITKQGADIDGVRVEVGAGSYKQFDGSMLFGKHFFDLDLLVWGRFYKADGQSIHIDKEFTGRGDIDGDVKVGAIGSKPSYDVGTSIKYKNMQFLYNTQFSQVISPMTMTYMFEPYDIDRYKTYNGIKPSFSTLSHHADLSYGQQFNKLYLKGNIAYDNSDLTHYQVISDVQLEGISMTLPIPEAAEAVFDSNPGISRYISGQEHTFGAKVQGDWNYIKSDSHNGYLSGGLEYNYFKLDDCRYNFGYNFVSALPESNAISDVSKGNESNMNAYVQLKHQWKSFILNAGLRFDFKTRYDTSYIRQLSPRIALIYLQPKWNVKLSYSKSYIDAPYLYRKTNIILATMQRLSVDPRLFEPLEPELLHSYQLTLGLPKLTKGLNLELNAFYNHAVDLIVMDLIAHYNSGNSDIYGLEFSGKYERRRFAAYLSAAWIKSKKYESNFIEYDKPFNTPEISANAVLSWQPIKDLKVHSHLAFCGKQYTSYLDINNFVGLAMISKYALELIDYKNELINNNQEISTELIDEIQDYQDIIYNLNNNLYAHKEIDPYFTLDLGVDYTFRNLELSLNVKNLFNKKYYLSGASTGLIPQRGRWLLFEVAYKF